MSFPNLTYENIQEKGVYIKLYFLFVLSWILKVCHLIIVQNV